MIGFVGWMNPEIRLAKVEDEPAFTYIVMGKSELVPNERAHLFSIRCVEYAMDSLDQLLTLNNAPSYITMSLTLFIFSSR